MSDLLNALDLLVGIHHINIETIHLKLVGLILLDAAVSLIGRPVPGHNSRTNLQSSAILSVDEKSGSVGPRTNLSHALLRRNSAGDAFRGLSRNSGCHSEAKPDKKAQTNQHKDNQVKGGDRERAVRTGAANGGGEVGAASAHFLLSLFLVSGFLLDISTIPRRTSAVKSFLQEFFRQLAIAVQQEVSTIKNISSFFIRLCQQNRLVQLLSLQQVRSLLPQQALPQFQNSHHFQFHQRGKSILRNRYHISQLYNLRNNY